MYEKQKSKDMVQVMQYLFLVKSFAPTIAIGSAHHSHPNQEEKAR
jgi:hypothetical protein